MSDIVLCLSVEPSWEKETEWNGPSTMDNLVRKKSRSTARAKRLDILSKKVWSQIFWSCV